MIDILGAAVPPVILYQDSKSAIVMAMALYVIFMILVSLENVKKCVSGGCTITSKTKINVV